MPNTRAADRRPRACASTASYVSYPVCCPSRATYLTGQYAHNHGVMGLYPPTGGYGRFDKRNALPVWLQSAGYHTAHLGKFLNGYGDQEPADVPPGWSDWHATVDYSTYQMWGYTINDNGRMHTYGRPFNEDPRLYQTDVLTSKATSIIKAAHRRQRATLPVGQLPRPAPRGPLDPAQDRHARAARRRGIDGAFASAPVPHAASFNEADMLRQAAASCSGAPTRSPAAEIATDPRDARARRAALLAVDDGVAANRHGPAAQRRARQHLHHLHLGQRLHAGRAPRPLREDAPLRAVHAGAAPHPRAGHPDRAACLARARGQHRPRADAARARRSQRRQDGRRPLADAVRASPSARTRSARSCTRPVALATPTPREQDEQTNSRRPLKRVMSYRAIRTTRWLYIRWRGGSRELYDMRADPDQMNSLHAGRSHRRVRRALARRLHALATCAGDSCR